MARFFSLSDPGSEAHVPFVRLATRLGCWAMLGGMTSGIEFAQANFSMTRLKALRLFLASDDRDGMAKLVASFTLLSLLDGWPNVLESTVYSSMP